MKLKPLFKKGSKTVPKNYRPMSLLPPAPKIIEKVIHDQTQSFLDKNKIIYGYSQVLGGFSPLIHVYLN